MSEKKLPLLITVTGPSGTGKDSVINGLMEHDKHIRRYASCVTRPMREGEHEGIDYYFITPTRFEELWAQGEMVERSLHYDNHYGVRKKIVQDLLSAGHTPIKDMTFTGTSACKETWPEHTFRIAILPPSRERLYQRLTKRNPNLSDEGKARFKLIADDLDHMHDPHYIFTNPDMKGSTLNDYDAVFVNDDLEVTVYTVLKRIEEERERRGKGLEG
jgi:guanylate kinase